MEQILKLLVDADTLLDRISVSGEGAYRMVEARQRLKAVHDLLSRLPKPEVTDDG